MTLSTRSNVFMSVVKKSARFRCTVAVMFRTSSRNRNILLMKFVKVKENCIKRFSVSRSTAGCTYVCFVCSSLFSLFYDAFDNVGYIASNATMVVE